MRVRCRFVLILCLLLEAPLACAELVLVTSPKTGVEQLTRDHVINIYLGRFQRLASGRTAEPIDMPGDSGSRALFYRKLVGKSLAEINAYWARLIFSGKMQPPRTADSVDAALQRVLERPGAVAYVERSRADRRFVVLYEFGE